MLELFHRNWIFTFSCINVNIFTYIYIYACADTKRHKNHQIGVRNLLRECSKKAELFNFAVQSAKIALSTPRKFPAAGASRRGGRGERAAQKLIVNEFIFGAPGLN